MTDHHNRAISAALAEFAAWDIPIQPAVMKKVIEAYLREMTPSDIEEYFSRRRGALSTKEPANG